MDKTRVPDKEFHGYINTIINANRNKTLAVFIGAGISKTSNIGINNLPDWSKLINDIKSELTNLDEQDPLKIAQLYYLTFGPHIYINKIKKYFPDNIEPSIIHDMIFDLNPQIIITTNWDNILDNAVRKHGYLYDIIASDQELAKSTLPKKIIKMHGDFIHNNFVFKEEDYIDYSENFPLLENYIKGILTTHTVIFMGYSFNDIDIKHIIKWVQNRSTYRPPMYITSFEENRSQIKYLENYHIKTLLINNIETTELSDEYHPKTKILYHFLRILNQRDMIYPSSDDDIISFIYNKIIIFNDLQSILFSQIQSSLTNCKIEFQNGIPLLMFFNNLLSNDYNKKIREVYKKFICILNKCCEDGNFSSITQQDKLSSILEIFFKSGIKGVNLFFDMAAAGNYLNLAKCFPDFKFEFVEKIINFNFDNKIEIISNSAHKMIEKAFLLYQQEKYEEILPILDTIISNCRSNKLWALLFISMLNKNIIIKHLKDYQYKDKYEAINEYDLKSEYEKLPAEIQSIVAPIYNFLEFNDLYQLFFTITRDLSTKESHVETIKKGGIVYGSDGGKNYFQQENLLYFVINNKIMIENYVEYKDIHKNIISILLTEQAFSKEIKMNRIQLYAAIKYVKNQELIKLLECCFYNNTDPCKELKISDENKKWLVDNVYHNLSEYYISNDFDSSSFENYLLNSLFILSIIKFEKSIIDSILSYFLKIMERSRNSMYIYQGINSFLGIQFNLFSTEIDADYFLRIIELVIRKIINRELNGFEYRSFIGGSLSNIFGYAQKQNTIYNNENDIKQIILEISNYDTNEKREIISSILLNIYSIGTEKIKNLIKEFVLSIDNTISIEEQQYDNKTENELLKLIENIIDIGSRIKFELNIALIGIKKLDRNVIDKIKIYLDRYKDGNADDSYISTIVHLISAIYNKEKNEDLENLYNMATTIYENLKKQNNLFKQ